MKVYKALKKKKNLVVAISQLTNLIQDNNSIQIENEFEFNMSELLQSRKEKVAELVNLKLKLAKAALEIQPKIFEISELKMELQMLNSLDTKQGVISTDYSDIIITKKVQLSKVEVLKIINIVIEKIDNTQSLIDEFNYTHEI